ncbi:MAG: bifunctional phosphoribosylaminoimidazolecarboxamide formyltransferase/IMP cyclohydrolase [Anaerolineae bacterium]|nr:bifunctional phosphoribosylaminoimidazolecarboxamide formyltransferase/IMP cyclohydrolase [Anaerolineae bacterium]
MPRAILSVYDKSGLEEFAQGLVELGWDLVASGGTARVLEAAELQVTPVERLTQFPEMLGGRVKTLHPAIHAAILARDVESDLEMLHEHSFAPIDMVVCNLYPFQATVAQPDVTLAEAIEQIDIGGVTLLRAAAKNVDRVTALVDPADYPAVLALLRGAGRVDDAMRRRLAIKAFRMTRDYDTAIHAYLSRELRPDDTQPQEGTPAVLSLGLTRIRTLRYGENPHQAAGLYAASADSSPLGGEQLGGKALSYNNLLDLDSAWRAVEGFDEQAAVVIVKHLTPTGIAIGTSIAEAFPLALASDPVSAFGGVIAVNRTVDEAFVKALDTLFVEAIAAPDFSPAAQEMLAEKRKNSRLLKIAPGQPDSMLEVRSIRHGFLVQTVDMGDPGGTNWRVVSERYPSADELKAMRFAWKAVQYVRSNAIVLAVPNATVGIGGGLPSRVDAARLAVTKAGERAQGAAMASDAFFPFPDALEVAAQAGVTCVVQPGGSIRDQKVIDAANAADLSMIFTGVRHFRH